MMVREDHILGLGIETSCDETSIAIVKNGSQVLSNVIYSQVAEHAPFRGVVPEIASRAHLEKINSVFEEALNISGVVPDDLDYISVSSHPGLIGSLMIGAQFARSLALVYKKPIIDLNHLEAHFYAVCLEGYIIDFPFLGLLLSGGNSTIYRVNGPGEMISIGDTTDDALGEAFDKTAAIMGLPYPGGPAIEKMAGRKSNPNGARLFPRLLRNRPVSEIVFSFSGIKTAVLRAFRGGNDCATICYDFQFTVFELIERMLLRAIKKCGIRKIILSGGVAANETLRSRLLQLAARNDFQLIFPEEKTLCTDNGGMIAALGFEFFRRGKNSSIDFQVSSKR